MNNKTRAELIYALARVALWLVVSFVIIRLFGG